MAVQVPADKIGAVLQAGNAAQKKALLELVHDEVLHADRFVAKAIRDTKPFKPVDTGQYAASTRTEISPTGGMVYNNAPHAAIIEYGARPHWAPLAPLYWWAYRKFRVSLKFEHASLRMAPHRRGSRFLAKFSTYREREAMNIARAVQRSIAKRGQHPRHVFARATDDMKLSMARALKRLRRHPAFRGGR